MKTTLNCGIIPARADTDQGKSLSYDEIRKYYDESPDAVYEITYFEEVPAPHLITDDGSVFMGEESKLTGTYVLGSEAHLGIRVIISRENVARGFPCKAAIDTGAVRSCVSKRVADVLGLPIVGKEPVKTATGMCNTNLRIGNLYIGKQIIGGMRFLEAEPFDNFDVIIGMDIIGLGSLKTHKHIDGIGTFEFEI